MSALIQSLERCPTLEEALPLIIGAFSADSGTIHMMSDDGALHLKAAVGVPEVVLNIVRIVPIGKGMAGLCAERGLPVDACNIQSDSSGNVKPGAKATGMEGAIVVPIFDQQTVAGTLGIANRRERAFTPEEQAELIAAGRILVRLR